MRLFPQDLGPRWYPRLIGRRSVTAGYGDYTNSGLVTYSEPPPPHMGWLGRIWSRGAGVTPEEAAAVLPSSASATSVPFWLLLIAGFCVGLVPLLVLLRHGGSPAVAALILLGVTAASAAVGTFWGRHNFRRVHQLPLKQSEVEVLLQHNADPLQQQFLELVRDAIRVQTPGADEERLRSAVRALGTAVESLPQVEMRPLDVLALRAEAAQFLASAAQEADPVTADSLRRRVRAIQQRVDANEQAALLVRRTAALRGELEAQIAALRDGLAVYQAPSGHPTSINQLAEAALQVATEAANVASARAELDHAVSGWSAPPTEQPASVTLTRG